jgi:hypothetical protein
MPAFQPISQPRQLLVEGYDAARFLRALVGRLKLADIQVQNFGGNWELAAFLSALQRLPGFEELVTAVGVVRDADASPTGAFQSVCTALASRPRPGLRLGEAAEASIWPWDHPAFEPLKAFLNAF